MHAWGLLLSFLLTLGLTKMDKPVFMKIFSTCFAKTNLSRKMTSNKWGVSVYIISIWESLRGGGGELNGASRPVPPENQDGVQGTGILDKSQPFKI